ncbi:cysteine hydrolase family protein [Hoeflea olei]|uniref:Isochorismatase n=1 Tax=Hoeflea olei TaxID=1480615 RepID=A0A1C1YSC7_9HYPH|nr:cysteine hydrolase family protein [Hoeflea olei]OCW56394.1 isochorismatase [Hoeflea olei]
MGRHPHTALILVDVQKAFLEWEAGGMRRNNPDALANITRLLAAFRRAGAPVIHIRHASREAGSALNPEKPGYAPIDEAREIAGEAVIVKHVNSAFIGTDLEDRLRRDGIATLVIAGITTNHCVETTTRMAGNLGFDARLVGDACYTFDRRGHDGRPETAESIHAMTLSNLNGEFATIETTESLLAALDASAATDGGPQ